LLTVLALSAATLLSGCAGDKLFMDETARSQSDRYWLLRGDLQPRMMTDQFGNEKPNLDRLKPRWQTN
jgi:hypothetical protein